MFKKNKPTIYMLTGYYEYHLMYNDTTLYVFDCNDTEVWEEWYADGDVKYRAEECVDMILEQLKEAEEWKIYDLITDNKAEVINVMANFVTNLVKE